MPRRVVRHGCLQAAIAASLVAAAVEGGEPVLVRSRVVDIEYAVNADALPLDSVRLWYSLDRGESWLDGGVDEDRQSPLLFDAPQEGLYGFFLVLSNATGPSSAPPARTTEPQLWAFVDYTMPVVQLHPPRQTTMLGHRVLQIRWTAIDTHFGPRPVEIMHQRLPGHDWYAVTDAPLPNTGRYDWRLPTDLDGSMAVCVIVRDRGGHRVNSEAQVLEVAPLPSVSPSVPAGSHASTVGAGPVGERAALSGSPKAKERAARLFTEAVACGARGEYREGIARLREVVRLDPKQAEAFARMGDMLYRIGDFDRALNAYDLALRQQPTMRTALRGAAKVHRQGNELAAAASHLRAILRHNPNDAEVWVNLGDIAVYQGDDVLARECYARATRIDPTATQAIDSARKRLALMTEVSRTYHQDGK